MKWSNNLTKDLLLTTPGPTAVMLIGLESKTSIKKNQNNVSVIMTISILMINIIKTKSDSIMNSKELKQKKLLCKKREKKMPEEKLKLKHVELPKKRKLH